VWSCLESFRDTDYRALARERISTEHAAFEVRQQNKRQQGGWLVSRLMGSGQTVRSP